MHPGVEFLGDIADGVHRIDAGSGRGANRRHHAEWLFPRAPVGLHGLTECLHVHPESFIHADLADVVLSDPERQAGLLHRQVGMLGDVHHQIATAAASARVRINHFPRSGNRVQRAHRRGVINDAKELRRQAEPLPEPSQRHLLQFGQSRAGLPDHAVGVQSRRQHFPQDSRLGGRNSEVGQESRMIPMRHGGDNQSPEIVQHTVHRFALLGRGRGKLVHQIPRLDCRQNRIVADIFKIIRDPIDHFISVASKVLIVHLAQLLTDGTPLEP